MQVAIKDYVKAIAIIEAVKNASGNFEMIKPEELAIIRRIAREDFKDTTIEVTTSDFRQIVEAETVFDVMFMNVDIDSKVKILYEYGSKWKDKEKLPF